MRIKRLTGMALIAAALATLLSGCMGVAITVPTLTDRQIDYSRGQAVSASACGFSNTSYFSVMCFLCACCF